jgi:hypothetical protein
MQPQGNQGVRPSQRLESAARRACQGRDVENYWIIGAIVLAVWLLISPLNRAQAAQHRGVQFRRLVVSLAVAGGCVWFAWWLLATRCDGGC